MAETFMEVISSWYLLILEISYLQHFPVIRVLRVLRVCLDKCVLFQSSSIHLIDVNRKSKREKHMW